jgi:hypothetical protein
MLAAAEAEQTSPELKVLVVQVVAAMEVLIPLAQRLHPAQQILEAEAEAVLELQLLGALAALALSLSAT